MSARLFQQAKSLVTDQRIFTNPKEHKGHMVRHQSGVIEAPSIRCAAGAVKAKLPAFYNLTERLAKPVGRPNRQQAPEGGVS